MQFIELFIWDYKIIRIRIKFLKIVPIKTFGD